jgi:hypothetical protein
MKRIIQASLGASAAAAFLLTAGAAFAQVTTSTSATPSLTYTPSTAITSGTNQTVGTFAVSGDAQGATISSVPVTVTGTNGGSPSNLTNCQFYGQNGAALGTSFNPGSSASSFTFNSPLSVGGTAGNQSVTVRCDVAGGLASGANFQFAAGTPTYGNNLAANFITVPTIPQGGTNVALGIIGLDAMRSGSAVTVTSLPVTVTPNGAAISALNTCSLRNITSLATPISAVASQNGSVMTFGLSSPLIVNAGSTTNLVIVCNLDASTPVGSSFAVSLTPSQIAASANGTTITPAGALGDSGSALPTSGTITVASAGSGNGTGTGTGTGGTGIPGIPNTGAGGNAVASVLMLALAGLLAVAGSLYLGRRAA